jgi:pyoverdine/dityrosine biosynthesis protein Dit1
MPDFKNHFETSEALTQNILAILGRVRNPSSLKNQEYHPVHGAKIRRLLRTDSLIRLVLPAFPAKSPNSKKTLNCRPDYGEVLALEKLNQLCQEIAEVYAPGAEITICSDGRVFSDLVQVSDDAVDLYSAGIRQIIQERDLNHIKTFSLEDLFGDLSYDEMRENLVKQYAEPLEILKAKVRSELEAKMLFNGIHRFLFEDQLELHPARSKSQTREIAKDLAYQVIQRSNAWSRIVEEKFPNAIRLSIHPQHSLSEKIGIRLLPSSNVWRTPWHSVAVFDGEGYFLAPRAEVENSGATLMYVDSVYPYYSLAQNQLGSKVADL